MELEGIAVFRRDKGSRALDDPGLSLWDGQVALSAIQISLIDCMQLTVDVLQLSHLPNCPDICSQAYLKCRKVGVLRYVMRHHLRREVTFYLLLTRCL